MSQYKKLVGPGSECQPGNSLTSFTNSMTSTAVRVKAMQPQVLATPQQPVMAVTTQVSQSSNSAVAGGQWANEFDRQQRVAPMHAMPHNVGPVHYPPTMGIMPPHPLYGMPMMAPGAPMAAPQVQGETVVAGNQPQHGGDDMSAAKRMVEMLRNSGNPKFANSSFVEFIDRVAKGDLSFKDGEVVDRDGKGVDWDSVYGTHEDGLYGDNVGDDGGDVGLGDSMDRIWRELNQDHDWLTEHARFGGHGDAYEFKHASNEYIEAENPLEIALRLIAEGRDAEAIIALEAEVRTNSDSSEGWRLLGQLHAQFDRDVDAIKCLEKGHECDPYNLESMLALGVSLTNELDSIRALRILQQWITNHETYHSLAPQLSPKSREYLEMMEFSALRQRVEDTFNKAAAMRPDDPEVAIALGVIHNIGRNYTAAIHAFMHAAELKPNDATVWNKLGATLANSGFSAEAILAYHQALTIKPKYPRAWSNLAIAHTNMNQYDDASKFFLTALQLSPQAEHLWSSLLLALSNSMPDRIEIGDLIEARDIPGLTRIIGGGIDVNSLPKPKIPDRPAGNVIGQIRQGLNSAPPATSNVLPTIHES